MDQEAEYKLAVSAALRYLSIRVRSRQELLDYLENRHTSEAVMSAVMDYLDSHSLINDADFAAQWVSSRLKKSKGDLIIRHELRLKGITQEQIDLALQAVSPGIWLESMEHYLAKNSPKWVNLPPYQQKAKKYALLRQRGFGTPHIDAILNHRVK